MLVNNLSVNFDKIMIHLHAINIIFLPSRYYKNSIPQQSGWNNDVIDWCRKEAERLKLKPEDYWGGLIFDEMKIQVKIYFILTCKTYVCSSWCTEANSLVRHFDN